MNQTITGLSGTWTHSFEEDEGDIQTYRPNGSFAFPPSRQGRDTLDFQQPDQFVRGTPGSDDRLVLSSSGVTPLGTNRFRIGDVQVIEVIASSPDMLKIRLT